MNYTLLPITFLKFWFFDSPRALFNFFMSLNNAFFELFSLPLMLKTYFHPLKNEYRQGLIGFSRAMGIIVKTFLIIADVAIFTVMLVLEVSIFVSFVLFPIATIALLFY